MDIFVLISVFKLLIRYPDLLIASASFAVAIILGICRVRQATRVEAFERRLGALGGIWVPFSVREIAICEASEELQPLGIRQTLLWIICGVEWLCAA